MHRSLLGVVSLSVFLLATSTVAQALARPATLEEASKCAVAPLPVDDVAPLLKNAGSDAASRPQVDDTESRMATPQSSPLSLPTRPQYDEELRLVDDAVPASDAERTAALEFINRYLACIEAHEYLRAFALVSPRYLSEVLAGWRASHTSEGILAALAAPPMAVEDGDTSVLDPVDVEISILPDGRLHVQHYVESFDWKLIEAEIFILEGTASGYTLTDWYTVYYGDPCQSGFILCDIPQLKIGTGTLSPEVAAAFVACWATPTIPDHPHPVVVTDHMTRLQASPDFDPQSPWQLDTGIRLEVTAAPISVFETFWIPVRIAAEDAVLLPAMPDGYVAAGDVAPVPDDSPDTVTNACIESLA